MASLAGNTNISQDKMSQTINLKIYLGRDATLQEKQRFIQVAIERINNRTLDGSTIHGGRFKKYSPEYARQKGVSESSVDLFLHGDMLGSLEGSFDSTNMITIEVKGAVQIAKAYNHHVGDTLKKRPWFGITTAEARQIAIDIREADPQQETTLASLLGITGESNQLQDITEESLADIVRSITLEVDR